jgi:transcription termination/antitermination protein NusG
MTTTTLNKRWYIVHVQANCEKRVAGEIEKTFGAAPKLTGTLEEVFVPIEKAMEVKDGKKKEVERRFFPGYVLVRMAMNDDTWQAIKSIPKVTGFIGIGNRPSPVSDKEVAEVYKRIADGTVNTKGVVEFSVGDTVSVVDGPFASFNGNVDEVDETKRTVRVSISIFGRVNSVELTFQQVKKTEE